MSQPERLEALLGPDLWALVCSVGGAPVEATELTSLPSAHSQRASFRVAFSDGRVAKVRRMADTTWARRVIALRGLIPSRHLPHVLAVRGAAILTEWCPGTPPRADDPSDLEAAGALLGSLHAIELPAPLVQEFGFPVAGWSRRLERNLATLERLGALPRQRAALARDLALSAAPRDPPRGLVHGDFCPENLIVAEDGSLVMIDNENLTVDALAFDLARTCYRWPLQAQSDGPFWAGYRTRCDPTPLLEHAVYWTIQTLCEAAAFRAGGGSSALGIPLERLDGVLSGALEAHGPPA